MQSVECKEYNLGRTTTYCSDRRVYCDFARGLERIRNFRLVIHRLQPHGLTNSIEVDQSRMDLPQMKVALL